MINITKIYLVTNIDNDPNKVYIGKTKSNREYDHKRKFGNQITYDYIDEINSLNKNDWEPLESYWIEQFRQWGFDIINKNKGGGGPEYHTEETKCKMRKPKSVSFTEKLLGNKYHLGKKHSIETKQKISQKRKGWVPSIERGIKISNLTKNKPNLKLQKPIIQYDKQGNFIKLWDSASQAALSLNKHSSAISSCCKGKGKIIYGFIWRYK
jgi:group I intron endonuclease